MGSRSGGNVGEDTNPNGDRTDDRFLSLALFFFTITLFFVITVIFTFALFFVLGRFVDLDLLETNDVYRRKADLESQLANSMI
jgi:hypothetical protein